MSNTGEDVRAGGCGSPGLRSGAGRAGSVNVVMLECQVQAAASQLLMVSSARAAALAATQPR